VLVIRIRFSRQDLAHVRFVISPMAEVVLSISALNCRQTPSPFLPLRETQYRNLSGAPSRTLLWLVPAGWRPRVALAPVVGERPRFDEELNAVLEFNPRPVQAFLNTLGSPALASRWTSVAPDTAREERRLLSHLLTDYYSRCLADYWPGLRMRLEADIAFRNDLRAKHGITSVLPSLHSSIRWNQPNLEIASPGPDRHLTLNGLGLVLVPSVFVWPNPSLLIDGYGQPVLLYPLKNALASPPWPKDVHDSDALGALLGATRAAVLSATANGENTTRIAQRLSISIASASQHLSVLRAAGLVNSVRQGRDVHHQLTSLGVEVLLAAAPFS